MVMMMMWFWGGQRQRQCGWWWCNFEEVKARGRTGTNAPSQWLTAADCLKRALSALNDDDVDVDVDIDGGDVGDCEQEGTFGSQRWCWWWWTPVQPDEKCSFNIVRKDCVLIVLFQIYHDLIREGVSVTSWQYPTTDITYCKHGPCESTPCKRINCQINPLILVADRSPLLRV